MTSNISTRIHSYYDVPLLVSHLVIVLLIEYWLRYLRRKISESNSCQNKKWDFHSIRPSLWPLSYKCISTRGTHLICTRRGSNPRPRAAFCGYLPSRSTTRPHHRGAKLKYLKCYSMISRFVAGRASKHLLTLGYGQIRVDPSQKTWFVDSDFHLFKSGVDRRNALTKRRMTTMMKPPAERRQ